MGTLKQIGWVALLLIGSSIGYWIWPNAWTLGATVFFIVWLGLTIMQGVRRGRSRN